MWALTNQTAYAAERTWVLDKNAAKSWVVVVKATYDVLPDGSTRLSGEQEPPLHGEKYAGEPGKSSVLYDADLKPAKAGTDVVLNGRAHAPRGRPAAQVDVTLKIHEITKRLRVFGDRRWKRGLVAGPSISAPELFESLPITYERAFGGWDTRPEDPADHRLEPRNPVGAGFATRAEHLIDGPLPNVEDPRHPIASWKDRPGPAGFGVVASYWFPRQGYAGTYDDLWKKDRFPLPPLDFDERFHRSAPEDQQVPGFLRGGEDVELTNLTPEGRLAFRLPKVHPAFVTRFGRERVEHHARMQTVIIEPDAPRVILVWHTSLPCHHRVDQLDGTLVFEKPYVTLT